MGVASILGSLGDLEKERDQARAIAYCQEEMAIYRELGNRVEVAHALMRMGNLHYHQSHYEAARQAFAEALGLFLSIRSEVGFAYVRMHLGNALYHLGDVVRALELYREALALYEKSKNEEGNVWALERIGIAEATYGDARTAARLMGAASVMRKNLGLPLTGLELRDWEEAVAMVRTVLQESHFASIWEDGSLMTVQQAIVYALDRDSAVEPVKVSGGVARHS